MSLCISHLIVHRGGVPLVRDVSLTIAPGELHVLLGRNGSGKSTFVNAVMGHPACAVAAGTMTMDGVDIVQLPTHERARKGLFLSLQQPTTITGVRLDDFLRTAMSAREGEPPKTAALQALLGEQLARLRLDPAFAQRGVNDGLSGGEKKRTEMVQMLTLAPKYALLDEPDSGLDADAVAYVSDAIAVLRKQGTGFLVVTHYAAFLSALRPDAVHVMREGVVVQSGGQEILVHGIGALL